MEKNHQQADRQVDRQTQRVPGYPEPRLESGNSYVEVDLDEIFRLLWRRKLVILGTVATTVAAAIVYLNTTAPRYTAEALVQIEPADNNIVGIQEVVSAISGDATAILGEVQIMRSRAIADKVISDNTDPRIGRVIVARGG